MPKMINEEGNKYGKLTVLTKSNRKNSKGELYWLCQCECDNKVEVLGRLLRNGTTRSCGCLRKNCKTVDEIGNQYGNLTVISKAEEKINNHIAWNCQCKCGNTIIVSGSKLRNGEKTCCPLCSKRQMEIDETNNIYGDLKVLEKVSINSNRQTVWKCQCSCGNICNATGVELRKGDKTHCGCKKILSKGAEKIKNLLSQNNINFLQEKTFENCRFPDTNSLARFDFYLPDYNILIEYDGEQHFFYTNHSWDTKEHFEYTKKHDQYKTNWCKENNIKLIRIPYYDYKQITFEKLKLLF